MVRNNKQIVLCDHVNKAWDVPTCASASKACKRNYHAPKYWQFCALVPVHLWAVLGAHIIHAHCCNSNMTSHVWHSIKYALLVETLSGAVQIQSCNLQQRAVITGPKECRDSYLFLEFHIIYYPKSNFHSRIAYSSYGYLSVLSIKWVWMKIRHAKHFNLAWVISMTWHP